MSAIKSPVLNINNWVTSEVKYMAPKLNDKGGKAINVISKQTNRALAIQTPMMPTWGIADFVDDKGESDGKFSISLLFSSEEYSNPTTDAFLAKIKEFENHLLDDAVKNSELWFGEPMSREVVKHMYFPLLKYSKNKETKKIDYTKAPSLRAKVPNYAGKWNVEIYDTASNMIFPGTDPNLTPIDFVPKLSNVACVLGISQVWVGGKGWGCTLKMNQCIVKPKEIISTQGKCQIQLSDEDMQIIDTLDEKPATETKTPITEVADSDDDEDISVPAIAPVIVPAVVPVVVPAVAPVVVPAIAPVIVPVAKKMIVKKKVVA